ncbi:hypothetical protein P4H83_11245 [Paenibacillus favisporus]|uniref:GAP1-N2 domain-containing protein n=1 Tax=Paenibacillus favisporus TaxID=221028 RepID=UPI002DBA579C|nr:hypothetical protein [Paenibacillus favisporus]MEC0175432.1 hypothetical protein [Paenibacillus favisporus]
MPDFTPKKVQQQMYTRERRGIFRSTEGFDTIARSLGLEHGFIKKVLHPFCQYDAPAELTARSEKEAAAYPDALHLFRAETGETVLGRSVYQPADFTGLRSAFFTHNYVLPPGWMEQTGTDYRRLLNAQFTDHYDIELGPDLPELGDLPVEKDGQSMAAAEVMALLEELHIDEKVFKQLLFAAISSVSGKKKVYIVLDVPVEQLSVKARELLHVLYGSLPYALRSELGFLTYAKEPQSKKGIHLTFVEKGGLRLGDRSVEKDYLFELVAGRVINVDLDWSKQPYLDFAWANLRNPERAEEFYAFADQMMEGMEPIRRISIAGYHELCALYQIDQGREELYTAQPGTVLHCILDYLSTPGAIHAKARLNQLFLTRFDKELDRVKLGEVPGTDIIESIKDYYAVDGKNFGLRIVEYFIRTINNALSQQREDIAQAAYGMLESTPALSRTFFARVLSSPGLPALLFEPYIENRLKQAATASDLVELAGVWVQNHPIVLENAVFTKLAETQLMDKLGRESDPVRAVNAVMDQLDDLERDPGRGLGQIEGGSRFVDRLVYAANLFLLKDLDLERLSREQLLDIGFLREAKELRSWVSRFDARIRSKANVMLALYQWFGTDHPKREDVLDGLSFAERDQVQYIGRGWLQREVKPEEFEWITLAFCQDVETGAVDYGSLLDFVYKYGDSPETVYEYIQWSADQPLFVRPRGLVPAYAAAIVSFMKRNDPGAFRNKDKVKRYFDSAPQALQPAYARARSELAPSWMKFFRNNRKPIMLSSVLLVIVIAAGITMLTLQANGAFDRKADPVDVTKTPVASQPPATETATEIPLLTAEQVKDGEQGELTELTFHFKQPEACRNFKAGEVTVLDKDGNILFEAIDPQTVSQCAADPAGGTDSTSGDTAGGKATDGQTADSAGTSGTDATGGGQTGETPGGTDTDTTKDGQADTGGSSGKTNVTDGTAGTDSNGGGADAGQSSDKAADQSDASTGTAGGKDGTASGSGDTSNGSTGGGADSSGTTGTTGAPGSGNTLTDEYTSTVTVKLGKKLDISQIEKVNAAGGSFVLTANSEQGNTDQETGDTTDEKASGDQPSTDGK